MTLSKLTTVFPVSITADARFKSILKQSWTQGTSYILHIIEDMTNSFIIPLLLFYRNVLRRLLLQPQHRKEDILSLEEILAEGVEEEEEEVKTAAHPPPPDSPSPVPRLCKVTMKALQQAAYYSAEHGYLDVTMELREMGENTDVDLMI